MLESRKHSPVSKYLCIILRFATDLIIYIEIGFSTKEELMLKGNHSGGILEDWIYKHNLELARHKPEAVIR